MSWFEKNLEAVIKSLFEKSNALLKNMWHRTIGDNVHDRLWDFFGNREREKKIGEKLFITLHPSILICAEMNARMNAASMNGVTSRRFSRPQHLDRSDITIAQNIMAVALYRRSTDCVHTARDWTDYCRQGEWLANAMFREVTVIDYELSITGAKAICRYKPIVG